jgi:hypothetical protein
MGPVPPKLIRVQDRLTVARDAAPIWKINPRTGTLDARAGLSWTGIRPYRTANGVVRVLRRPEQVNSEGHRRTLHRLPQPEGHPAGDVNVGPTNIEALNCGWTGDAVDVETVNGYPRPVGNMSVFRVSTIANMVDDETWAEYCELFPDVVDTVKHTVGNRPRTGTSLGYNALWYEPHVESEIVSERDDGALVGEWMGPNGPEQYDIEHIIDPNCDIVLRLRDEVGFRPEMLGANHNAIGLQALGGRGAEQAELMRIVDSRSLPITSDQARIASRVALQVNRVVTRDAAWTVGTDRDLDIVSGEWDGDKAARSVFDWAGWPDAPKPEQARRAFLIYDADAPELIGSYKLPIAEYRDGGLVVIDSGLRAAASYLPQTDAPEDVLKRAREVLDSYFARMEETAARDSSTSASKVRIMNKKVFQFSIGHDNARTLAKLGLDKLTVQDLALTLDEIDANAAHAKLMEMQGMLADLLQMVGEAKGDVDGMKVKMADMMSVAEATAAVDKVKAQLAEAEQALAVAKEAEGKATADAAAAKQIADNLTAELAPFKAAEFKQLCADAVAAGYDPNKVADCKDAAALRRHVVLTHPKLGEAKYGKATDEMIAAVFDGAWATRPAVALAPTPKPASSVSSLASVPPVNLQRAADSNDSTPKTSTADEMEG